MKSQFIRSSHFGFRAVQSFRRPGYFFFTPFREHLGHEPLGPWGVGTSATLGQIGLTIVIDLATVENPQCR